MGKGFSILRIKTCTTIVNLLACKNYSLQLTNFSTFMSGSSIYCFPLFFFFLLQDIQYQRLLLWQLESQRGKISMQPRCLILAVQSRCRLNCFRPSAAAVKSPPFSTKTPPPLFFGPSHKHFPLPQTWTFYILLPLFQISFVSFSYNLVKI